MKKKSGKIFLRGVARTFVSTCVLLLIFMASYKLTGLYLEKHGSKDSRNKIKMEREGRVDSVSFHLIFSLNEASKELEHVVLETFNTKTDCLMYTTIPMDTKLAMSHELYDKVRNERGDMPQIISFDAFKEYVKSSDYYDFGASLIEDALDVSISYYTIVPSEIFNDIFMEEDNKLVFVPGMKEKISQYEEEDIASDIKKMYKKTKSNLTLSQKMTYTPALSKVEWEDIIFNLIPGNEEQTGYAVDKEKLDAIWEAMKNNYVAEEVKGLIGLAEKVSLGKNIIIYNGSGINGLAGNVKNKLEAEGYTITQIGNYTSTDVQNSIIQVKEEGLGNDLIGFLKHATVEKNESLPTDVDIQIVLGKSES